MSILNFLISLSNFIHLLFLLDKSIAWLKFWFSEFADFKWFHQNIDSFESEINKKSKQ